MERGVGGEGERGGPRVRGAHEHDGAEEVGADERAVARERRPEVVPDERGHRRVAQRGDESDDVVHEVELSVRAQVVVVRDGPSGRGVARGGAAVAPRVGRNDVVAQGCERENHAAPGEGEFGEPVQEEDEGRVARTRLQDVDVQVADFQRARDNAFREAGKWFLCSFVAHSSPSTYGDEVQWVDVEDLRHRKKLSISVGDTAMTDLRSRLSRLWFA